MTDNGLLETPVFPEAQDQQQHFELFLPKARALDAALVRPYPGFADVAHYNVTHIAKQLLEREVDIRAALPLVNMEDIRGAPLLASGVRHAVRRVDRNLPAGALPPGKLKALQGQVRDARRRLVQWGTALATEGLIPAHEMERIRKGTGAMDMAQDTVDLVVQFRKVLPQLQGKCPITGAELDQAAAAGTLVLSALRPQDAKDRAPPPKELVEAVDARDRLWTLLVQRHELMWKVGAWLWGLDVDAHVPALLSRDNKAKSDSLPA